MSPEELTYLLVLAVSIPVGFLFKHFTPPVKQGAALILGLALTVATCGIHTLHSLITVLGTWGIITYSWRFAPSLALSWSFLYLLFFRLVTWFGLPAPTPFTNAVQLLLTLKMVSLANEVQAFHLAKKQEVSSFSKSSVIGHISKVPSLYDVLCYSYCYIGIMTGPFYRYQTYEDWLCQRTPGSIPALTPCVQRLRWVPLYAALFLGVSAVFPLAHVRSEDFLQHHFLYRLFYMVPVFFVFRMRFYAAWCTAEASCIAAGLGAYPEGALSKPGGGPTVEYSPAPDSPVLYDFETVRNIDCYNTDFCVKVRHGMRYWNMSVQWWLHNYIYRNAPFRSYVMRAAWTMFISAYWHGLHVGYYLSFLTIPLCLAAETSMERGVRSRLSPAGQYWFDWVHWFLKMRAYDYMCMGFVLLSWGDTLRYWGSVYYCIQVVALLCIVLGQGLGKGRGGEQREKKGGEEKQEGREEEETEKREKRE
ncbi:lysophospholipid acyltransferase 7 [Acipenser ruthenus]|uniref:lysophospholipid acyltransferase 7 n=1 Tax=Acipenser ruthenus TaxID=7906 RepID=UPI002740BC02|nr:lysophospholipid acyltransferase 7 [Acipenser ruthenus]XP_058874351.1 lysophospholipid acyltransferase 7 [Acipenser ruthenus]XP_058874352.1 lysophospholipid acyltransferase 7 [Acipenser ruthenus]